LQNENVADGNEHFVDGSAVSSDEENVKVKYNKALITENVETQQTLLTVYPLPKPDRSLV
jgi:hypothetical protein